MTFKETKQKNFIRGYESNTVRLSPKRKKYTKEEWAKMKDKKTLKSIQKMIQRREKRSDNNGEKR